MSIPQQVLDSVAARQEIEELQDRKQKLKTERDALQLAKEIYDWLEAHPIKNAKGTCIIHIPKHKPNSSVEVK